MFFFRLTIKIYNYKRLTVSLKTLAQSAKVQPLVLSDAVAGNIFDDFNKTKVIRTPLTASLIKPLLRSKWDIEEKIISSCSFYVCRHLLQGLRPLDLSTPFVIVHLYLARLKSAPMIPNAPHASKTPYSIIFNTESVFSIQGTEYNIVYISY